MILLLVLALATATSAAVTAVCDRFSPREAARLGMAIAMSFAGASHLLLATPFIQHLPTWVPLRAEIVLISGLALYLVAVFPGSFPVAVFDVEVDGQPGGAYPWVRLPLQLLFIAWALWSTREARRPVPVDHPSDHGRVQRGPLRHALEDVNVWSSRPRPTSAKARGDRNRSTTQRILRIREANT